MYQDARVTGVMLTQSRSSSFGGVGAYLNVCFSGLGLFEYLTWCEDLNMEPIMAVWAGN